MIDEERILILAPLGRDAPLAQQVLTEAGLASELCPSMDSLCAKLSEGAGALLLTEEVLVRAVAAPLVEWVRAQPPWSDLPLVVFGAKDNPIAELGNVTLLDRPVRIRTLLSAMRSALRARRRQYQSRDLLHALQQSMRDRDQFLAMLGHELRNPLAAIVTAVELAELQATPPRGSTSPTHDVIARQARHLSRLVDDLLDVARVTSGKIALQRVPLDLREVVDNLITQAQPAAQRQGLRLVAPQGSGPISVLADATRVEQIVGNLLGNAIKYTPRGGEVRIELGEAAGRAFLRVTDTGVGIPGEVLPRVFDLFTQAPASLDRAQGGMGIGLTLVKRLVELHGGSVRASSPGPGRGSTFEVQLPANRAAPPASTEAAAERSVPTAKRRVLLVEDNPDSREVLLLALEALGHEVTACADGDEAVERALHLHPETMVVDLGLPLRDGYQVAQEVRRSLGAAVRLIALTGYGQPEDRARALAAGFDDFLIKPADLDAIQRALVG